MKYATIIIALMIGTLMSCRSSKETVQSNEPTETRSKKGQRRGGKHDVEKMFARMDANNDGRLAKIEAKGRLAETFDKVDVNGDGYITKEEMQNAPKPERGNRGTRRN